VDEDLDVVTSLPPSSTRDEGGESDRPPRPRYWTPADAAELEMLVRELMEGTAAHPDRCPTCQALRAGPCPERQRIAAEWRPYDLQPLAAPPGFLADLRRRLTGHEERCATCALLEPGHCAAVDAAIAVVFEWRQLRGLLTRAQVLRQVYDRNLEPLVGGTA
jgi:hypothetical protein